MSTTYPFTAMQPQVEQTVYLSLSGRNQQGRCRRICYRRTTGITKKSRTILAHTYKEAQKGKKKSRVLIQLSGWLRTLDMVRVTRLELVRHWHTPLKRACLPIPAHSHFYIGAVIYRAPLLYQRVSLLSIYFFQEDKKLFFAANCNSKLKQN